MAGEAILKTPLNGWHQAHRGRLVEFGGWSMPVQYSTIIEEHQAVRQRVGLFDISHMGRLEFQGPDALAWLEKLTTNHVAKLAPGQIQYSLILTEAGGILDDILVYNTPTGLAVVCNASNRKRVVEHFEANLGTFDVSLVDRTFDTAMIAIQGPAALATAQRHLDDPLTDLPYYYGLPTTFLDSPASVSRTGYTGEDGFELIVRADKAVEAWEALIDAGRVFGVLPIGLGARDTLRFEAAMPLHGHEMDDATDPYAAGLGWAVKLKKGDFIGRTAILGKKGNATATRVGLELGGKRIARQGAEVSLGGRVVGRVTSGTFSPTLGKALAMASVEPSAAVAGTELAVDIRGQVEPATVVPLPFYRRPATPA
jgi:aminomethyltransferase